MPESELDRVHMRAAALQQLDVDLLCPSSLYSQYIRAVISISNGEVKEEVCRPALRAKVNRKAP